MSHNIFYRATALPQGFNLQDHADTIKTAWANMLTTNYSGSTFASGLHVSTKYTDVKLYELDATTGLTADLAQSSFGTLGRGLATNALPSEVAVCATLETGEPGRTKRGRIYLGGFTSAIVVGATGRLQGGNAAAYAEALAAFMQQSRDQSLSPDGYRAVVYSRSTSSTRAITRVTIGDVFDVQRRRRSSLVESRQGANVPT